MIDIESKVVDTIFNAVTAIYPNADITTGFDEKTAIFPCVVVKEINNEPYTPTNTDDCAENHARLSYQIDVYTDDMNKAKTEGKKILGICDTALQGLKFRRIHKSEPLDVARTLFRQYARYEVIVSKPMVVGENTIYQFYRR
jgi:hypothetical protein